jgi:hypothetical protein
MLRGEFEWIGKVKEGEIWLMHFLYLYEYGTLKNAEIILRT